MKDLGKSQSQQKAIDSSVKQAHATGNDTSKTGSKNQKAELETDTPKKDLEKAVDTSEKEQELSPAGKMFVELKKIFNRARQIEEEKSPEKEGKKKDKGFGKVQGVIAALEEPEEETEETRDIGSVKGIFAAIEEIRADMKDVPRVGQKSNAVDMAMGSEKMRIEAERNQGHVRDPGNPAG